MVCIQWRTGHLSVRVGDSLQCSEEIVKSQIAPFNVIMIIIIIIELEQITAETDKWLLKINISSFNTLMKSIHCNVFHQSKVLQAFITLICVLYCNKLSTATFSSFLVSSLSDPGPVPWV